MLDCLDLKEDVVDVIFEHFVGVCEYLPIAAIVHGPKCIASAGIMQHSDEEDVKGKLLSLDAIRRLFKIPHVDSPKWIKIQAAACDFIQPMQRGGSSILPRRSCKVLQVENFSDDRQLCTR